MADDTTPDLGPEFQSLANLVATGQANAAQMAAYQAVLSNLNARMSDYSKLGPAGYKDITPQQLGPSALSGIQNDAQARGDEQAAISQLGDIASSGGLELSDRNALNQLEQTTSRNNAARQNSLKNQFAARGQLGSGAELAMDLANNQNAAQLANTHGEDIAAQAQKRAMEAVLEKGKAAHSLSSEDYARKKAAAEAADSIAAHNASLRTDASKYNNTIAGQNLDDQLRKLAGESTVTGQMNTALLGQGNQKAAGIVGQGNIIGNQLIPGINKLARSGSSGSSNTDTPDVPGTQNTSDFNANLQPDPTDPGSGADSTNWGDFLDEADTAVV